MPNIKTQSFTDVMVLSQCHSIMAGGLPTDIPLSTVSKDYEKLSNLKDTKQSFGLYSSGINYNTYYPDASASDLTPVEAEFVEPLFRLISACILAKNHNPTDFSTPGVLEKSMYLLKGQSVYCDHDTDVGNAIGAVKEVAWQEGFDQDGVIVPPGINGVLKIDGKSNPRLARGIMMDPPSIHSNSVTVTFKWKPSHTYETIWGFYDKLGTYDDSGELVRRIVTEIISYSETSLVHHGADPFAQKLVDGKLNHIAYAAKQYYGAMENSEQLLEELPNRVMGILDFKQDNNTGIDTMVNSVNKTDKPTNKTPQIMENEDLMTFVASLFQVGMLQLAGEEKPTLELAQAKISSTLKANATLQAKIDSLEAEAETGRQYLTSLRASTLGSYQKLTGDKQDAAILALINNPSVNADTLKALGGMYSQQLEEKFPVTCSKCGSKDVSRGSAVATTENSADHDDEQGHQDTSENNEDGKGIASAIKAITNAKQK